MVRPRSILPIVVLSCTCLLLATPSLAQTISLDVLWPNTDGLRWTFDGHYEENIPGQSLSEDFTATLTFDGTNVVGGETVQNLVGRIDGGPVLRTADRPAGLSPLLARLWVARPDLRGAIAKRATSALGFWPFLLLAPANGNIGFLKTPTSIGDWRDEIADQSWLYLVEPKDLGSTFTLQLIPDLADDVFLYGTVTGADVSVQGLDGNLFEHCWRVEYTIDMGETSQTDELGNPLGTFRWETTGFVAFGADIGPVLMEEQTEVVEEDCPTCPFTLGDVISQGTLGLQQLPIATETASWSDLKSRY